MREKKAQSQTKGIFNGNWWRVQVSLSLSKKDEKSKTKQVRTRWYERFPDTIFKNLETVRNRKNEQKKADRAK